jgi:hypothetical protein
MRRALDAIHLGLFLGLVLALAVLLLGGPPVSASASSEVDPGVAEVVVAGRPGQVPRVLTGAEVATVAAMTPVYCSGYGTLSTDSTGEYSTKGNVCLYEASGTFDVGAVSRFQCFKRGVLYGAGLGGCRWTWNQVMQRSNDGVHWTTMTADDRCFTCGGEFVSDSGRLFGTTAYALWCGYTLRAATRGTSTQAYQVRFYRSNGTEQLLPMSTNISGHWKVPC